MNSIWPEADTLAAMTEALDTLRAIGAGEVDAFVVSDRADNRRIFTLSTADRPYRMFVENMRDGAATVSSSGLVLYANRRLTEMVGREAGSLVGSDLRMIVAGPFATAAVTGVDRLGTTFEFDLFHCSGRSVPVLVGSSLLDVDGDHLTCLTFTDLSAQKEQEAEIARLNRAQAEQLLALQEAQTALVQQATHDSLTGLPNRVLLIDRIEQALFQARRSGHSAAVLFIDLDRFKHVNDTKGHAAGDALLLRVARQLSTILRPMDTVARVGGDEFVVLAPDIGSFNHAIDVGTRVVTELSRHFDQTAEESIAASVGISVSVAGRGDAQSLMDEADQAMYVAKARGGRRAEVFTRELGQLVEQRSTTQRMLRSAVDDERIIVYYQPIVDLMTGRVAGFEALARIAETDGTVLLPGAFISVAEDSGLVVPLGAQVLDIAVHEAVRWRSSVGGDPWPTVAVNISSHQFQSGNLFDVIAETLERSGLPAESLLLELTETTIIDLHTETIALLGRISDLGVQIGLDDFGTGYASLVHLRRLPLSFIKIDQSFVAGLGTNLEDERIVAAVIDLAANLGLRSVAEGVETAAQLERLRELRCDEVQGYYLARPMPASDLRGSGTRFFGGH